MNHFGQRLKTALDLADFKINTNNYFYIFMCLTQFLKDFPFLSTFTPACFNNSQESLSRRRGFVCINFLAQHSHM